jgi:hypothetical protein
MSDEELSHPLSERQQNARQLNEASDSINQTILAIEQKIIASNVGLACWLTDYPIVESTPNHWEDHDNISHKAWSEMILGFAKLDQNEGWRLAVFERTTEVFDKQDADGEWAEETKIDDEDATPLYRASRELRIEALQKMPLMIKLLSEKAKASLQAIAKAKKLVE